MKSGPSPATLFVILMLAGIGTGAWLSQRPMRTDAPSATLAKNEAQEPGLPKEDLEAQILLLEGQVEYLQGQNSALIEENEQLRRRLSASGAKGIAKMEASPEEDDPPDFEGLTLDMMKFRKLQALPLPTVTASLPEVEERILEWLRERQPGDEALRFALALTALGWIEQPVDPLPLRAALLARQLGGWYDAKSGQLHVVDASPAPGKAAPDRPLAVAFGQVLREYGSTLFPKGKALPTDALLARESLLAGDAGLTRFLLALEKPSAQPPPSIPAEDPDHPLNEVPMPVFLKELALFPFHRGFEFAQSLHSMDGFRQINAAYSRPPMSTAEVIEPSLYLSNNARDLTAPLAALKLADEAPYWDDSLGRYASYTALRTYNSDEVAGKAVKGWQADRLLAYAAPEHPRDDALWQTVLSDTDEAARFFEGLKNCLAQRHDTAPETDEADRFSIQAQGRHVLLRRNLEGRGVQLIDTGSATALTRLQAAADAATGKAP